MSSNLPKNACRARNSEISDIPITESLYLRFHHTQLMNLIKLKTWEFHKKCTFSKWTVELLDYLFQIIYF